MYKIEKLENGLRVLLLPIENSKSISMHVTAQVGSRYESREINGISHFLEHLMFKGTKERPSTEIISKELDSIGANFNAFTAKDRTAYYITAHKKHLVVISDILADMLQNSLFDAEEVEKEKGVIIEEIHMYEDNPLMSIEDLAEDALFGDNPLGWDIAGPEQNIKDMTAEDIKGYYEGYYHPENLMLVLTGDFDEVEAMKIIKEKWGAMPVNEYPAIEAEKIEVELNGPELKVKEKETKQYQLAFAFPGVSYTDDDAMGMKLLGLILGGNMSSRLFLRIREKQGLCYLVRSYNNYYEDNGAFIVQAGLDKERIKPAITAILNELKLLRDEVIDEAELEKAKNYLEGKLSLGTETAGQMAGWYTGQLAFHSEIKSPEKYLDEVKDVSVEDIKRLAENLFQDKNINLALIGQLKGDKKEIEDLLKFD